MNFYKLIKANFKNTDLDLVFCLFFKNCLSLFRKNKPQIQAIKNSFIFIILGFFVSCQIAQAKPKDIFLNSSDNALKITSLMSAVIDDDIEGVKFFSKMGKDEINKKNIAGATALNLACRKGNTEIIKILVEKGADVNIADNENWTPLMRCALSDNEDAVKILLKNKANPSMLNSIDESALIQAANSGCLGCFAEIFNHIINSDYDNSMLKNQLGNAFEIAKNHEDEEMKALITTCLNQTKSGAKFALNHKEDEESFAQNQQKFTIVKDKESPENSIMANPNKHYIFKKTSDHSNEDTKFVIIDLAKIKDEDVLLAQNKNVIYKFNGKTLPKRSNKKFLTSHFRKNKSGGNNEIPEMKDVLIKEISEQKPIETQIKSEQKIEEKNDIKPENKKQKQDEKISELKKSDIKTTTLLEKKSSEKATESLSEKPSNQIVNNISKESDKKDILAQESEVLASTNNDVKNSATQNMANNNEVKQVEIDLKNNVKTDKTNIAKTPAMQAKEAMATKEVQAKKVIATAKEVKAIKEKETVKNPANNLSESLSLVNNSSAETSATENSAMSVSTSNEIPADKDIPKENKPAPKFVIGVWK